MKIFPFLFFLFVVPFLTKGQDLIEGKFRKTALYSTEILEFKRDGTFSFYENSCGLKYQGKGSYFLNRKILLLDFDSQLDKTIGVFSQEVKKDSTDIQSSIQVFDGFKHRNDIGFSYLIYFKDSLVKDGRGDPYHSLHFYPDRVDSILLKTFFISNDSLVPYQENKILIASSIAYTYTLLTLAKNGIMDVGKSHNKQYKIRLNRSKTRFKVRDGNNTWIEYKLFPY